jgi:hypothetical protein
MRILAAALLCACILGLTPAIAAAGGGVVGT